MTPTELSQDKRDRLLQLIEASTNAFESRGYRRTTMADIARRMGVAPGTVYLYAEGKEALFAFLVHWHLGRIDISQPLDLPVRAIAEQDTLDLIRNEVRVVDFLPSLAGALTTDYPPDPVAELRGLIGEVYSGIVRYRRFFGLVEGSALDWPEMAHLFYQFFRQRLLDEVAEYLRRRISCGHLAPVPDEAIAARLLLETAAWFAYHRHGDKYTPEWPAAIVEATVVDMLVRSAGVVPPPASEGEESA